MLPALAAAALAAAASPLAASRADLDGDGRADSVTVDAAGVSVTLARGASRLVPFTQLSAPATAEITAEGNQVLVKALGRSHTGEAILIRVRGKAIDVRERLALFVTDPDTGLHVDAALRGGTFYRFLNHPGIVGCHGEPVFLETQMLDRRGKLVPAPPPVAVPPEAPRIEARRGKPDGLASDRFLLFKPSTASSVAGTAPDLLGAPVELVDDDRSTAWVEGRPGPGRGEALGFRRRLDGAEVAALRVVPHADRAFNRPKTLAVELEGDRWILVDLPDAPGAELFATLPRPLASACASIYVLDVYPGDRHRDQTAIAELAVVSQKAMSPGGVAGALAREIAKGGADARAAERLLEGLPDAPKAIARELDSGRVKGLGALRLRRVLARRHQMPAEIARGLEQADASEPDRELFAGALQGMGPPGIAALVRAIERSPLARPAGLAALIDIKGPEAFRGLLSLAGKGDRTLRRGLALALGRRDPAELGDLIAAAADARTDRAEADLWRAVGLLARRAPAGSKARADAAASIATALGMAKTYELRYRLLVAAGGLAEPASIAAARQVLAELAGSEHARDVALRRVGVSALGENRDEAAVAPLVTAAADADAGVRARAISALAERADAADADAVLIDRLEKDAWPRLRRAAAGALAARCARPEPRSALIRAAATENHLAAGEVVLASLVRCVGPGAVPTLMAVALSGKRPTKLRVQAVLQLARIGGPPRAAKLIELFRRFVKESWSSSSSLALAQANARALCVVEDKRAVAPLADAARRMTAFPELQAAAARALGCYCDRRTMPLLRRLASSAQVGVSVAARSSLKSCRRRRR